MTQDEMRFSLLNAFRRKTFDVDVIVHYGRLKQDLQAVKIVYELDGIVIKETLFNYLEHEVADRQHHLVQLPSGNYLVIIELRYLGPKPHSAVCHENDKPEAEVLRLHRSLFVHGNTEITLSLDQDDQS
jgi:hypothetical protein